jgi:hypothetical protein
MAVGVFVGTSIGPPATQGSLDAFHVAGMHQSGSGNTGANALATLLNASEHSSGVGMVVYLRGGGEAAARKLAGRLPKKTVESLLPRGRPVVLATGHSRALALLAAREIAYGSAPVPENCVVVPVSSARVRDALALSFDIKAATGLETFAWPLRKNPFVVVEAKSAKAAATLVKSMPSKILSGLQYITAAYPNKTLDGEWTVETQVGGSAPLNPRSCGGRCARVFYRSSTVLKLQSLYPRRGSEFGSHGGPLVGHDERGRMGPSDGRSGKDRSVHEPFDGPRHGREHASHGKVCGSIVFVCTGAAPSAGAGV